ncbi:MAG: hypothetical protein QOF61_204 [Acidobacteriota bacterium]|jgi:hypothetical protein|nr:hypothetical protein [Acidobacteriota bacterium]
MKISPRFKTLAPPLVVACAGLLLSFPAWLYGLPAVGDSVYHASWYTRFAGQFWAGNPYPRWLLGMNAGLGSPTFFFYAPVPFHIASLLQPLLPTDTNGLRHLGIFCALALTASGLTAYLWLRKISGAWAAALGAGLYVLAPYHVVVDLYNREAYTELWAFVWAPLVLRFTATITQRPRRASFAGLSISYALLASSHLPATLIFSPLPIFYAYSTAERGERKRATVWTLAAMTLGAGLAAVYLLPALFNQDRVTFADMHAFNYFERWVTFTRANVRDLYGQALWGALTSLCLISCAVFAAYERASKRARREIVFWVMAAAASVLMMTFASDPVWRILKVVQKVQFPWRFGFNLCLAVAGIVAVGADALQRAHAASRLSRAKANLRLYVFAALIVAAWIGIATDSMRRDYEHASVAQGVPISQSEQRLWRLGRDAPEYKPARAASNSDEAVETIARKLCHDAEVVTAEGCVAFTEGDGAATFEHWRPREIDLRVETQGGARLTVAQFYYEGWAARLDGAPHALEVAQTEGLLSVAVPAGAHTLTLRLLPGAAETAGRITSAVSLVVLLLWCARTRFRS